MKQAKSEGRSVITSLPSGLLPASFPIELLETGSVRWPKSAVHGQEQRAVQLAKTIPLGSQ
jgi:hypothetical protein